MSLKSYLVDRKYFRWGEMSLITVQYQENEWSTRVGCNVMMNLK